MLPAAPPAGAFLPPPGLAPPGLPAPAKSRAGKASRRGEASRCDAGEPVKVYIDSLASRSLSDSPMMSSSTSSPTSLSPAGADGSPEVAEDAIGYKSSAVGEQALADLWRAAAAFGGYAALAQASAAAAAAAAATAPPGLPGVAAGGALAPWQMQAIMAAQLQNSAAAAAAQVLGSSLQPPTPAASAAALEAHALRAQAAAPLPVVSRLGAARTAPGRGTQSEDKKSAFQDGPMATAAKGKSQLHHQQSHQNQPQQQQQQQQQLKQQKKQQQQFQLQQQQQQQQFEEDAVGERI